MMHRRTIVRGGLASAAAIGMPSVGRGQGRSVVKFIPQADLALLDPVQSIAMVSRNHGLMVFDTLYGLDASFNVQPQMAAGQAVEDGGRTVTITLRDGLRFHDGTPVLARDVVASIKRWWRRDTLGQTLAAATDELSAPTDRTIRFSLKQPFPQLTYALGKSTACCFIMPERLAQTEHTRQVAEMVGSGPFRFIAEERMAGQRVVYEKFAGYVPRQEAPSFTAGGKAVHVDRVEWHILPDPSTAAAALRTGEMDWWEQPTADLLPLLKNTRNVQVEVTDRSGWVAMIGLNHLFPPFDNPAMRRALLAGVNQSDFMIATMGEDRALWRDDVGFFLPGSPLANDAGLDALRSPRSTDRVRAELQAAGYRGERVVMVVPSDLPTLKAQSEVAADMLRRSGINLDYQSVDWGTALPRLTSQKPPDQGGWNIWCNYIAGAAAVNPASHSFMRGIGTRGIIGWPTSEGIERIRDAFMAAPEPAEQRRLATELQAQAFRDLPYIPTGFYYQPTAYRSSLTGMVEGAPVFWGLRKG